MRPLVYRTKEMSKQVCCVTLLADRIFELLYGGRLTPDSKWDKFQFLVLYGRGLCALILGMVKFYSFVTRIRLRRHFEKFTRWFLVCDNVETARRRCSQHVNGSLKRIIVPVYIVNNRKGSGMGGNLIYLDECLITNSCLSK